MTVAHGGVARVFGWVVCVSADSGRKITENFPTPAASRPCQGVTPTCSVRHYLCNNIHPPQQGITDRRVPLSHKKWGRHQTMPFKISHVQRVSARMSGLWTQNCVCVRLSAKMYWIWSENPFGANLTHFGSKSGHSDGGLPFHGDLQKSQVWKKKSPVTRPSQEFVFVHWIDNILTRSMSHVTPSTGFVVNKGRQIKSTCDRSWTFLTLFFCQLIFEKS